MRKKEIGLASSWETLRDIQVDVESDQELARADGRRPGSGMQPRLANIRVRRTWRGLYPMTPDGFPIVGWAKEVEGYLLAVGMCGQGLMLGPGLGELLTMKSLIAIPSSRGRNVNTPTLSRPFMGGTNGLAPAAMSSLS
jgi:hypothetical protein